MESNYSSDRPVNNYTEDRFQRYNFSKRIAETIKEQKSEECIVIGLYGAWGEGKSSVINFIDKELRTQPNIVSIKFNAWRYMDENALLSQFFNELAKALNASLKKNKEKFGEVLKKYGKFLDIDFPFVGNISEHTEKAGEILSEVSIETLKDRIGKILKENATQVVIFIDDIDRLNKDEIQAIFRLVKLTGDFAHTTYVLAFDENMVAAALGERYAEGNKNAGKAFLEKIIQVPLKLPVAQPDALKQYCLELIDRHVSNHNIIIEEEEISRFANIFTSNVLIQLVTPRLAVRYSNSLAFSLPLLYGEVNTVDLMLIEALKIFYPNHYEFVKNNAEYFIRTYNDSHGYLENSRKKEITKYLDEINVGFTQNQKNAVASLLISLFPVLNEAFNNYSSYDADALFASKRIGSPRYFNRYFTYSVIKGEVSDIMFDNLISNLLIRNMELNCKEVKSIIADSSVENFILKLRMNQTSFDWERGKVLAKCILYIDDFLPLKLHYSIFNAGTPEVQATVFVAHVINIHDNRDEAFEFAKEVMQEAKSIEFAYSVNNFCRKGSESQARFTDEQYNNLGKLLIDRSLKEANDKPIFITITDTTILTYLFSSWAQIDKRECHKYIEGILLLNSNYVEELLWNLTINAYVASNTKPFKMDLSEERYRFITNVFDKKILLDAINNTYSKDLLNSDDAVWSHGYNENQTEINIIRQFLHWNELEENPTISV